MIKKSALFFAVGIVTAHAQSSITNIPTYPETQLYSFPGTWTAPQTFVGGINLSGSLNLGTGTLTAKSGYFSENLQDTQAADTYIVTGNPRNVMMQTTLSPSANTSTIWENDSSFVYINGPGHQNGEVNGFHSYFEVESGAYLNEYENFEASNLITGTLNQGVGYLENFTNGSNGTTSGFVGMEFNYLNNNITANSVAGYTAILINQFSGTKVTANNSAYGIVIKEPTASFNTLGGVGIGTLSSTQPDTLVVYGPDTSQGTYFFQLLNSSGQTMLQMNDAGGTLIGNGSGGFTAGATCSGTPTSSFASINGFVTHC